MSVYTRLALVDQQARLQALPPLPGADPRTETATLAATGTDDAEPRQLTALLSPNLRFDATAGRPTETTGIAKIGTGAEAEPVDVIAFPQVSSEKNGEDGIRTREAGLSPPTGLANRRYRPLSHLSKPMLRLGLRQSNPFPVLRFTTAHNKNVSGTCHRLCPEHCNRTKRSVCRVRETFYRRPCPP